MTTTEQLTAQAEALATDEQGYEIARERFLEILGEAAARGEIPVDAPPFTENHITILYNLGMLDALFDE